LREQQVFAGREGRLRRRPAVLIAAHQLDLGKLADRLQKAFFAVARAGRALLVAQQDHVALAAEQRCQLLTRQPAGCAIVGGHEACVVLALEIGVEDDDGHAGLHRCLHGRDQRRVVERCQHHAGDTLRREALHQVDLRLQVVFLERPLPDDLDAQLFTGLHGAGVHGLPKLVRRSFGYDGQAQWLSARRS
jgi:hypothetical protein